MERRRSKRKNICINAEIVLEGTSYPAIIESFSENGINLETDSKDHLSNATRFNPETEFEIRFKTPYGEEIKLHCKVIWSYRTAPHGLKRKIGMEIIFPPPSYVDFYRNPQQS